MKTIRVTGKGDLKVHPDMTRISMTLTGRKWDYGEALQQSAEDTEQLKATLSPFGFEPADVKTLSFDVDTRYESYQEKHGGRTEYKSRFDGYVYTHRVKVEFESDNELLGKILYVLANCQLHPEFRLSYTVKDQEAVKNELLGKAVRDAAAKAKVLSGAAGVKLGDIQSVDYSWGQIRMEVEPMEKCMLEEPMMAEKASYDINIEPDDIEVQDTVTVIWEIV